MFATGELRYDPRMITQQLLKESALSEQRSIFCRIDENGGISLFGLDRKFFLAEARPEAPGDVGHVSVGEPTAAAMSLPSPCALPPRVAGALAKAWRRPWKRAYMTVCLRLIGVTLRE